MLELPKIIALASLPAVFLICLIAATRRALPSLKQRVLFACLFWSVCSAMMWAGLAGMISIFIFPPQHFTEDHQLIGEMPPEFGAMTVIATLGFLGALAGLLVNGLMRLYRRAKR